MESVTYTLWCQECGDEVAAYKGETGRNAYSRGVEHLEHLEANDEDKSVLWLHSLHHHQSRRDVNYGMKVGFPRPPRQENHGEDPNPKLQRGGAN